MNWLKEQILGLLAKVFKPNLKEVSTWQGIFKMLSSAGILTTLDPTFQSQVIAGILAVLGVVDYLRQEKPVVLQVNK